MKTPHFPRSARWAQRETTPVTNFSPLFKRSLFRSSMLLAAGFWLVCSAQQATAQWINTTNGFYHVSSNWSGNLVPGNNDQARFQNNDSLILWDNGTGNTQSGQLTIDDANFIFTGCCGASGIPFTHTVNSNAFISSGASLTLGNQATEPMNLTTTGQLNVGSGGTLTARFGSVVSISGATYVGGTVNVRDSGSVLNATGVLQVGDNVDEALLNLTNSGRVNTSRLVIRNSSRVNVTGAFLNAGEYDVSGGSLVFGAGGNSTIQVAPITLRSGLIDMSIFTISHNNVVDVLGGRILEHTTNIGPSSTSVITIDGGTFDTSNTFTIAAQGTVNLDRGTLETGTFLDTAGGNFNHTGGTLIVDGGTFNPGGAYFTGNGTTAAANLALRNGASANLSGSLTIRNGDAVTVESGSTFSSVDVQIFGADSRAFAVVKGVGSVLSATRNLGVGFSTNSGRLTVLDGGLARADGAFFVAEEGQLSGNGTLEAFVVENRGEIDPNNTASYFASSRGTLNIDGNYNQTSAGDYIVDLSTTEADLLSVDGNATLAGELSLFSIGSLYNTLEVLTTTGSVSGTFNSLTGIVSSSGEANAVTYDADSVNVTRAFQGDVNLDGEVDVLADAASFINRLGTTSGATWVDGDFNGDGAVDVLADGAALVSNLGRSFSAPTGASTSAVPEPSSLALFALSGLATGLRRRKI